MGLGLLRFKALGFRVLRFLGVLGLGSALQT